MAKIRKTAKPNKRVTVHQDNRTYRIEERAPDLHLRKPKMKPYKDK